MAECKPKSTPLPIGSLMNLDTQPHPISPEDKEFMADKDYPWHTQIPEPYSQWNKARYCLLL